MKPEKVWPLRMANHRFGRSKLWRIKIATDVLRMPSLSARHLILSRFLLSGKLGGSSSSAAYKQCAPLHCYFLFIDLFVSHNNLKSLSIFYQRETLPSTTMQIVQLGLRGLQVICPSSPHTKIVVSRVTDALPSSSGPSSFWHSSGT